MSPGYPLVGAWEDEENLAQEDENVGLVRDADKAGRSKMKTVSGEINQYYQ